jgi:hypothetical protein
METNETAFTDHDIEKDEVFEVLFDYFLTTWGINISLTGGWNSHAFFSTPLGESYKVLDFAIAIRENDRPAGEDHLYLAIDLHGEEIDWLYLTDLDNYGGIFNNDYKAVVKATYSFAIELLEMQTLDEILETASEKVEAI